MKTIQELKNELKEAKRKAFLNAKSKQEVIEIWEEDKRVKIPKEVKRVFCWGCRSNYYNGIGASECWNLEKSKLCKRRIYPTLDSTEPDDVITLNCYTQEYHK